MFLYFKLKKGIILLTDFDDPSYFGVLKVERPTLTFNNLLLSGNFLFLSNSEYKGEVKNMKKQS